MNDTYLRKGKRIDTGEWVEGNLILSKDAEEGFEAIIIPEEDSCMYAEATNHGDIGFEVWHQVDPSTVCRCTGKNDMDKKLIFEHDAVSFLDTYSTESGYAESWCIGEVLWDDETLSFQVTNRLSAESYEVLDDCKVLGNSIDNPELLEGGAE